MTDSFHARIPILSDAELRQYLEHPTTYKPAAVEAAVAELQRRGAVISDEVLQHVRDLIQDHDTARKVRRRSWGYALLGSTPRARTGRIRAVTGSLLAVGLGSALIIYLAAGPKVANPLGYEPEDTKRYLRDLELYGGKVNVLATEFMRWWNELWHGRNLAVTVAWLTLAAALLFWFIATRMARDLDALGEDPSQ